MALVTAVTSFGRSGLADWLVQRVTAVVLAAYTFFIVAYLLLNPDLGYAQWSELFTQLWMRIFSLAVLLSIVAHGWIGMWSVLTDYVTKRLIGGSALFLRTTILAIYALVNFAFIVWGVEIIWGY